MACESMVDKLVELKPIVPMYFDHNKTKAKYWGDLLMGIFRRCVGVRYYKFVPTTSLTGNHSKLVGHHTYSYCR